MRARAQIAGNFSGNYLARVKPEFTGTIFPNSPVTS